MQTQKAQQTRRLQELRHLVACLRTEESGANATSAKLAKETEELAQSNDEEAKRVEVSEAAASSAGAAGVGFRASCSCSLPLLPPPSLSPSSHCRSSRQRWPSHEPS